MKRVFKSQKEPGILLSYRLAHPHDTWERFRRHCHRGYDEVKDQILQDQHGLCAYCEIAIKRAETADEVDDFRVEHFYPKNATEKEGHNYHLDWRNMLGVCHGGSQPDVPDAEWRYSTIKTDRSCDVPKGGKPISQIILNPLLIPAKVRIFRYSESTGKMIVDRESCPHYLQRRAKNTIRELNLNANRLMRMRKEVINKLEDQIQAEMEAGASLEETLALLAESMLLPNYEGQSLSFFSVIRWYLGEAAENVIRQSGSRI